MSGVDRIASCRPVFGQSLTDKAADLALMERFAQPGEIERWLEGAHARGVRALIVPMDERILSVLRRRSDLAFEIIPMVPNVMGLVREATEYGMMGAGFRLVWRLGIGTMVRLGFHSLPKAKGVLRRDFPTMLSVLFDLELSLFRALKPRRALLHPQITDLVLAMGNERFFHQYAALCRKRFGVEPGVATGNFGTLAAALERWQCDISLVLTAVNAEGWQMKPDRETCQAYLKQGRFRIIADRVTLDPPPSSEAVAHASSFPAVRAVAVDVADWSAFSRAGVQP